MQEKLFSIWQQDCAPYITDDAHIMQAWTMLKQAYENPKRHYHNFEHIEAMRRSAEEFADYIEDTFVVHMAIWFHDIVYTPPRKDNERKSANIAYQWLQEAGVKENIAKEVQTFILATQNHSMKKYQADLAFFLDFDLKILAAPPTEYLAYTEKIRKEYQKVPTILYKKGRKKALLHFTERTNIYHSAPFIKTMETQAQANLQSEIASL
ncbi:MAG: hypothetical protein JJT94_00845 [Bernardetiaceae bacterium]|nr:hypothetical protein [Bernardetiaceae bacterium]